MADLKIRLQPKQSELWRLWDESEFTRIGFGGARGGSKSGGGRRCMIMRRFKYPRTPGLILRRTQKELERSHLLKLFEEFPMLQPWWREQKKQVLFPNGSILFFGSAQSEKDMGDYYGAEFGDILLDEAQEFSQQEIEKLSASCRCTSNLEISCKMILAFMPSRSETGAPPKGLPYLKRVFIDSQDDPNVLKPEERKKRWAFLQAFSWDNCEWARAEMDRDGITEEDFYSWSDEDRRDYFLTRTEYGATLQAITDQHLRDAWLFGKWDVFQGQYFPNFGREHVLSVEEAKQRIKPWHKKWLSGDWGFDHPHVIHWHAQDETGRIITYREDWAREVGETDLGQTIGRKTPANEKISAFAFSWDAFGRLNKTTRKSITEMIGLAMPPQMPRPVPADASPGSRISGWRLMYQLLDAGIWQIVEPDGVSDMGCPKLIECLPTLMRNPQNTEDVLKVDYSENAIGDDAADSARMGLQYMLGSTKKPAEVIIGEKAAAISDPFERQMFWLIENRKLQKSREGQGKPQFIPTWQQRLK